MSPVPLDTILTIAQTSVRHYCPKNHPFFDDFRQDVLVCILERQDSYYPSQGTLENFIVSVARQQARNCSSAYRRERQLCMYSTVKTEPVAVDEELLFAQLTAFLSERAVNLLTALLNQSQPGIAESEYLEELKEWANCQFFKNLFKPFEFYPVQAVAAQRGGGLLKPKATA